jgi:ribosomal protein L37AE/L43A
MGRFNCRCGLTLSELNTDYMSTLGHVIPDQDWEDLCDGTEAEREKITRRSRQIWQCPHCATLHVSDGGEKRAFAPVDPRRHAPHPPDVGLR